jgi:hypothetical protein
MLAEVSYARSKHFGVIPHLDMAASKWDTSGRRDLEALQGPEMGASGNSVGGLRA